MTDTAERHFTDTAELIARADALLTVRLAGKSHLPESPWDLMKALRDALAAQAQEIERRDSAGIDTMRALQAAEARVRELEEGQICGACGQPWTGEPCGQKNNANPFPTCYPAIRDIKAELAAKEAATIERCAKVADSMPDHEGPELIAAAICALAKEPTAAPPGPAASP